MTTRALLSQVSERMVDGAPGEARWRFHKLAAIRCVATPLVIARIEDVPEDGA